MKKALKLFAVALIAGLFASCQNSVIGYGVLLWNDTEHNLEDGTVLPVYLKSNIAQQYIVGLPGTKEKIEIPLWKMGTPVSKSKANKEAELYKDYTHYYARSATDGLPIRADKGNTSKQIYRLKQNEIIRVLYQAEGDAVTTGNSALEGDWLRVLTQTGIQGWCFSYNLRLFELYADGTKIGDEEAIVEEDTFDSTIDDILQERWYPEYYQTMINDKEINLDYMQKEYGLDTGYYTGTIAFHMNGIDGEYPYTGITKTGKNIYKFNDAPVQITIRTSDTITVTYTDEYGMPVAYTMVTFFDNDINQVIENEKNRRSGMYNAIYGLGPKFSSSTYGNLTFHGGQTFTWTDWKDMLGTSVIPAYAKNTGSCSFKYFLPKSLKGQWDGIITMNFDGTDGREVNFLYKRDASGLRLSNLDVSETQFSQTQIPKVSIKHPSNALVIFMQR